MKIAVTGATGYIGERLARRAAVDGHCILALARRRPGFPVADWIHYDLESDQVPNLPGDTDLVIHLALSHASSVDGVNATEIRAAQRLLQASLGIGAKFVFVSSQTARPKAPTSYGRTKWAIEQSVLAAGGWVVRPGLVYGGAPRGLYGDLVSTVRRLPLIPAFLPAPLVQPIHVDDLATALVRLGERDISGTRVLCLGFEVPVSFTALLRAIATQRLRRPRILLPVPVALVSLLRRLVGEGLAERSGLARLQSLFELPRMDTGPDLRRLELGLRPLESGLHPSGDGRRRQLLIEARALLGYVLRARPTPGLLARYLRAIETLRGGEALGLGPIFARLPGLVAGIEGRDAATGDRAGGAGELAWRLDAATVLAEATPMGARRFLGVGRRQGLGLSLVAIARALLAEAGWRLLLLIQLGISRGLALVPARKGP